MSEKTIKKKLFFKKLKRQHERIVSNFPIICLNPPIIHSFINLSPIMFTIGAPPAPSSSSKVIAALSTATSPFLAEFCTALPVGLEEIIFNV